MKGRTKDKQKFNEEIDVLALFCFRGRAIASGGQIVPTPKRDVLHPVTLRVPQSLLGETTAGATTERQSLQRGEPAQRAASETSATRWLINRVSTKVRQENIKF